MLMQQANERVLLAIVTWLTIAPRRQCVTNGAVALKSYWPEAWKEDTCKCAPQAHLILDAQSVQQLCSCLRAQPHNLKRQQIAGLSCQAGHGKKRRPQVCPNSLAGHSASGTLHLQNGGSPADTIAVAEPFPILLRKCSKSSPPAPDAMMFPVTVSCSFL